MTAPAVPPPPEGAPIRFDDGAGYEEMMGRWTVLVGAPFLDWIGVPPGAHWLDVGCGNGAFTQLLVEHTAPASVRAFDPSEGQLTYARQRLPAGAPVTWAVGDAMALAVPDMSADAAVMALVLFFVPDPARGVAEMVRAVRPGGTVAAYHWDMPGGGFPLAPIGAEMRKLGLPVRLPPSVAATAPEAATALLRAAGCTDVRSTGFTVQRRFDSFDAYWDSAASSNLMVPLHDPAQADLRMLLRQRVRERLQAGDGPLTLSARAHAVVGRRP